MIPTALLDSIGVLLPVAIFLNLAAYRLRATVHPVTPTQWVVVAGIDVLLIGVILWTLRKAWFQRRRRHATVIPAARRCSPEAIGAGLIVLGHLAARAPYWDLVPRWDGASYYQWIANSTRDLDLSLIRLATLFRVADHPSHAYGLYLAIGQLLLPFNHVIANVQNTALAALGIYAFWLLLRRLCSAWSANLRLLLTLIFAFNPLYFGVSLTPNADLPVTVFLIVVLASYAYDRLIWFGFAGLCLCFSKEPGLLAYGLLLMLLVLFWAIPRAKSLAHLVIDFDELVSFSDRLLIPLQRGPRAIVRSAMVVLVAMFPLAVFLAYHQALPKASWATSVSTWKDTGFLCFGLNSRMFRTVLGEALLLNFAWIPTLLVMASIAKGQIWSDRVGEPNSMDERAMVRVLACLFVAYLLVHCLYINYLNPRYVLALVPLWLILAGYSLRRLIDSERIRIAGCSVFAALSVAQTWYALDPVSNGYWTTFKIGDRTALHVGGDVPADLQGKADGFVYNAQFAALERLYRGVNHYYLRRRPQPVLFFGSSHYWMIFYCLDPVRIDPATLEFTTNPADSRIGLIGIDELTPEHRFPFAVYVALPWIEDPTVSLQKVGKYYDVVGTHRIWYGAYYLDTYDLQRRPDAAPVSALTQPEGSSIAAPTTGPFS
jgi:hypothetical protein